MIIINYLFILIFIFNIYKYYINKLYNKYIIYYEKRNKRN